MAIEIENLSRLQHKLRRLPGSVRNVAVDEIQAAGVRIRDRARQGAPAVTRNLRASIRKRREAGGLNAKVHTKHPVAHIIEHGSKAHTIQLRPARGKRALAGDGFGPVRGPVRHPGTPARPFMHPAAEAERREFPRRLAVAINGELRRVAR